MPGPELTAGFRKDPFADRDDDPGSFGRGDELTGGDEATLLVVPAHEGLDRHHLTTGQGDDGLIMEDESVSVSGTPQLGLELETSECFGVHHAVEDRESRAPCTFGTTECEIGTSQQVLGFAGSAGLEGNSETC